jgi:hypothetical protein
MILFRAASGSALLAALRFLVHGRPRASFGFLFGHAAMFVAFFDVLGLSPRGNVVPANESPGRNKMALAFDRQSVEQGLQLWTEPVAAERPQWNEACACQLLCVWNTIEVWARRAPDYRPPNNQAYSRQGLGYWTNFPRANLSVWNGQPSFRARAMTECLLRLSATEVLSALAPLATYDRIRSSSSGVHGFESLCMSKFRL